MSLSGSLPVVKPTFSADFVNTERVDHRLTFARASTATFYDGVTTAKAEENLLLQSQAFNESVWNKSGATVIANTVTAPDGTTTAETITCTATSGSHETFQNATLVSGTPHVMSVFVKKNTHDFVQLRHYFGGGGATRFANFNIATGVLGTVGADATAAITDAGNGWYRCVMIATPTGSSSGLDFFIIDSATAASAAAFTAVGTESVYLWGAQLEQRSAVTAYTATTTAPITNYIQVLQTAPANVGRIAHDPITRETLGLHMESAATNLLTYSEDFANAAWSKTRSSILSNVVVLTGDKLVEDTSNGTHILLNNAAITLSIGVAYTYSIYAKAAERTICRLGNNDLGGVFFDLSSGAITSVGSGFSGSIQSIGNGWYRLSATQASNSNANGRLVVSLVSTGTTTSYTGDGYSGIYIWGAQLETGVSTSYIPTVASQVTRAADTCTLAAPQFDAAIRQGEGTLYAEILPTANDAPTMGIVNVENGQYDYVSLSKLSGPFVAFSKNNGTIQFELYTSTSAPNGVVYKSAVAYATNTVAATAQGLACQIDNFAQPPAVSSMRIGPDTFTAYPSYNNQYIRKVAYYPTRLANLNLEALTL